MEFRAERVEISKQFPVNLFLSSGRARDFNHVITMAVYFAYCLNNLHLKCK
jgi:hypothetical protein